MRLFIESLLVVAAALILASCSTVSREDRFEEWYQEAINEPYVADILEYDPVTGMPTGRTIDQ